MQALMVYQYFMPILYILWGMVALRVMQLYRPELAYVRESLVVRSVGRSVWRRAYDRWMF